MTSRQRPASSSARRSSPSPAPRVERRDAAHYDRERAAERQRIKTIIESDAGARSPSLAQRLAFEGDLSSADAIVLLEASPDRAVVAKARAKDILAAADLARAGGPAPTMPARDSLAGQILAAGRKARGEKL
jgi:hypothetical protein